MAELTEIRWHGRGGQGAKTAALLFAEVALSGGKYIQAFPEYGPERMGAPVQSFNRLSDEPITLHCAVVNPNVVVVLDATLMNSVAVTAGLGDDGILLVNTSKSTQETRQKAGFFKGKVFVVDASKISLEEIGKDIPNAPMLGALVKATSLIDFEQMLKDIEKKLAEKFRYKPEMIQGNIRAIKRAYEEVVSE